MAGKHKLPEGVSLPEKDVPILLAAIEARATHPLTGNLRHFGSYFGKRVEGIFRGMSITHSEVKPIICSEANRSRIPRHADQPFRGQADQKFAAVGMN